MWSLQCSTTDVFPIILDQRCLGSVMKEKSLKPSKTRIHTHTHTHTHRTSQAHMKAQADIPALLDWPRLG